MENEIWRDVIGYNGYYQVSNFGRVKTTANEAARKERILKPIICNHNYLKVDLYLKGKNKKHSIHRLVAEVFIPNPENKLQVNHLDGDKSNNKVENLEWCTHKENIQHSMANGLVLKGENHPMFGTKKSDEIKQKISTSLKGKHASEAKRENCRKAQTGLKRSEKHRENIGKALKHPISQYDLQGNFIKNWNSIREAANELGFSESVIGRCVNSKRKTAYKFIWKRQ